ncbi:MAG: 2-dehydropantoate 2-reductase [Gammaproteobacteria bacterium]|nr:2-dehydropantoate 2-reductase [Gammaproteobacteria bacterium]
MRVAIVGAGAIGLWVAGKLAKTDAEVSLLARGVTLKSVDERGVLIKSKGSELSERVSVSDDAKSFGPQDLVIFAVKSHDLPAAANMSKNLINQKTIILPAMNGVPWWFLESTSHDLAKKALHSVDPNGDCKAILPVKQVLGGVIHASCFVDEPGSVQHVMGNGFIIGSAAGLNVNQIEAVEALLQAAEFDVTVSADIRYDIWYKLWGNMTMNPLSALTGATCDLILDDPEAKAFASSVMDEASRIGAAIGCSIEQSAEDRHEITRKLGAFKTSMLQDAESGKNLEIGALLEAPQEIARLAGIDTPSLDHLLGVMRVFNKSLTAHSSQ